MVDMPVWATQWSSRVAFQLGGGALQKSMPSLQGFMEDSPTGPHFSIVHLCQMWDTGGRID